MTQYITTNIGASLKWVTVENTGEAWTQNPITSGLSQALGLETRQREMSHNYQHPNTITNSTGVNMVFGIMGSGTTGLNAQSLVTTSFGVATTASFTGAAGSIKALYFQNNSSGVYRLDATGTSALTGIFGTGHIVGPYDCVLLTRNISGFQVTTGIKNFYITDVSNLTGTWYLGLAGYSGA